MQLVQLLSLILDQAGTAIAAYASEVWSMLTAILVDSYHEVAMLGCKVSQQLAGGRPLCRTLQQHQSAQVSNFFSAAAWCYWWLERVVQEWVRFYSVKHPEWDASYFAGLISQTCAYGAVLCCTVMLSCREPGAAVGSHQQGSGSSAAAAHDPQALPCAHCGSTGHQGHGASGGWRMPQRNQDGFKMPLISERRSWIQMQLLNSFATQHPLGYWAGVCRGCGPTQHDQPQTACVSALCRVRTR